ncbi:hypothetical protein [Erythrobacter sp. SG61-1L]|uniref:hypothetical protein n=1 Tax=Erythrobacter sp. SG61-1L TaxID=1603897 RepID=UPI0019D703F7|nr:hypothetical protein [Erythrobacter sp. SG61-1L]
MNALLKRWHALPVGDRTGILARMEHAQRQAFERLVVAGERERAEAEARSRRFQACSPWLADLLDACEKDAPLAHQLTPQTRAALIAGHEKAAGLTVAPAGQPTLVSLARTFFNGWRARV